MTLRDPSLRSLPLSMPFDTLPAPRSLDFVPLVRPTTALVIGYGGRGSFYAGVDRLFPQDWQVTAVAEPIARRRAKAMESHGLESDRLFRDWREALAKPRLADACVVATSDHDHYEPAMAALEAGYDLLLEKPIAATWQECRDILDLAEQKGAIVGVCHVLRYAPYFRQLHAIVASGMIGEIVSVQHLEAVWHIHYSHSYVRGNWAHTGRSAPLILAKACHDLDVLRWLVDRPFETVSASGSTSYFNSDHKPQGAPSRCLDGCPARERCPYHAGDVYIEKKLWNTGHIETLDRSDDGIRNALATDSPYGRCVFNGDNDQPDHFNANLTFRGGVTANLQVQAMSSFQGRRTRLFGTVGDLEGDSNELRVTRHLDGRTLTWRADESGQDLSGHGGGDARLVRDFAQAVGRREPSLLSSSLQVSMASHLAGFEAEASRLDHGRPRTIDPKYA